MYMASVCIVVVVAADSLLKESIVHFAGHNNCCLSVADLNLGTDPLPAGNTPVLIAYHSVFVFVLVTYLRGGFDFGALEHVCTLRNSSK
jgi:hypothetical protein